MSHTCQPEPGTTPKPRRSRLPRLCFRWRPSNRPRRSNRVAVLYRLPSASSTSPAMIWTWRRAAAAASSSSPQKGKYSGKQIRSASCSWQPWSSVRARVRFSRLSRRGAGRAWMRMIFAMPFSLSVHRLVTPMYHQGRRTLKDLCGPVLFYPGKINLNLIKFRGLKEQEHNPLRRRSCPTGCLTWAPGLKPTLT